MGNIAPITPFDQIQYANRTVEANRKGKEITGVKPVPATNLNVHSESEWERFMNNQLPQWSDQRRQKNRNQVYKKQADSKEKEEAKAKITGKGQHINEFS